MAVFDNSGKTAKPNNSVYEIGKPMRIVHAVHDITAADISDGDIFVLAEGLTFSDRVHRIMSPNATPAATDADDNDIGIYRYVDGTLTAVDADILVDGVDLSSALSARDLLLHGNSSLDQTKTIGELLGKNIDEQYAGGLVLAMTMNTKTTADVVFDLDVYIEEATSN